MATNMLTANEEALRKIGKANRIASQALLDHAIGASFFSLAFLVIPKQWHGVMDGNPYNGKEVFAHHMSTRNKDTGAPWAFKAKIMYVTTNGDVQVKWASGDTKIVLVCKRHVWPMPADRVRAPLIIPTSIMFGGALAPKAMGAAQRIVAQAPAVAVAKVAVAKVAEVVAKVAKVAAGGPKVSAVSKAPEVGGKRQANEEVHDREPKQYKVTAPTTFDTNHPAANKVSAWCQQVKNYRQNVSDGKFPSDVCYDMLEKAHAEAVKNIAEIKQRLEKALKKVVEDKAVSAQLLAEAKSATSQAVQDLAKSTGLVADANKRNAALTSEVDALKKRLIKAQKAAAAAVAQLEREGLQRDARGRQLPPKRFSSRHEACAAHCDPVNRG